MSGPTWNTPTDHDSRWPADSWSSSRHWRAGPESDVELTMPLPAVDGEDGGPTPLDGFGWGAGEAPRRPGSSGPRLTGRVVTAAALAVALFGTMGIAALATSNSGPDVIAEPGRSGQQRGIPSPSSAPGDPGSDRIPDAGLAPPTTEGQRTAEPAPSPTGALPPTSPEPPVRLFPPTSDDPPPDGSAVPPPDGESSSGSEDGGEEDGSSDETSATPDDPEPTEPTEPSVIEEPAPRTSEPPASRGTPVPPSSQQRPPQTSDEAGPPSSAERPGADAEEGDGPVTVIPLPPPSNPAPAPETSPPSTTAPPTTTPDGAPRSIGPILIPPNPDGSIPSGPFTVPVEPPGTDRGSSAPATTTTPPTAAPEPGRQTTTPPATPPGPDASAGADSAPPTTSGVLPPPAAGAGALLLPLPYCVMAAPRTDELDAVADRPCAGTVALPSAPAAPFSGAPPEPVVLLPAPFMLPRR